MANVYAVKSGNWSDTTVWNTGSLPTSSDDVYSNNFTVTINQSVSVVSIRNSSASGIASGGTFNVSTGGFTLSCTSLVMQAGNTLITVSPSAPAVTTISGNISTTGSSGTNTTAAIFHSGTGTINYTGTVSGTVSGSVHIRNGSTGTVNITGTIYGSGNSTSAWNFSTGIINITGDVIVDGSSAIGSSAVSSGNINVTGSCYGGSTAPAVGCTSNGTVNVTGNIYGGTGKEGVTTSSSTFVHVGSAYAGTGAPAITGSSASQTTILTGPFYSTDASNPSASLSGVNPVTCLRWFIADTALSTFSYTMRGATVSGGVRPPRVLMLAEGHGASYPSASNVKTGIIYGPANIYTGTCAVPPAGSVLFGVPTDNTTGTVTITATDIRGALGMSSANLDTQLSALSSGQTTINNNVSTRLAASAYTTPPTVTQVRQEMDSNSTKLANLDASISSRSTYAGGDTSGTTTLLSRLTATRAGYLDNISAAPPSAADIATAVWSAVTRTLTSSAAPSAADVATAVRSELGTELGRIDANVSSRLAAASYSAPPSAASIRAEIDANSTKLDATVSSRLAAASYSAPPSAATNASAVRTELATELANLDATVSSRLATSGYTTPPTAATIATAVNSALDRTGFSLTSAERQAIATAVEQSVLNESDGQAILNAIVGAIGNQNIDQVALVAAIRADLERQGGTLATRSTLTAAQVRSELAPELANLDTAISTRSTYSGADTTGTTTLLNRLTSTRASNLDNISQTPPTAAAIASAVWSATIRTLTTTIDDSSTIAAAVWSAVARTLTANPGPSAIDNATAIRSELSTELGRIDTSVSSRLKPSDTLARVTLVDTTTTLTNAPDVPTESEIAEAVRQELTPELNKLDANISSRQVGLERLNNVSTTEEVGDIIEGLFSS